MIELTNIKTTDTFGQLRGQINTMQNEIMADQMVVGKAMGVSVNLYTTFDNSTLVGAITASNVRGDLWLLCLPESNGVYVAGAFGTLYNDAPVTVTAAVYSIEIDVASVKLPNRDAVVSTFVTPEHMGFTQFTANTMFLGTGVNYEFYTSLNDTNITVRPIVNTALVAVQTASHLGIKPLIISPFPKE